jgi:hypothetical protein
MGLNISLRGLTLTNKETGKVVWVRTYRQMRAILQPRADNNDLLLDFCEYGGTVKLTFVGVPSKTIHSCITGVIAAHVEWRGTIGVLPQEAQPVERSLG